jgi:adenosylcobinamide kinase/adenosylcobinamide-phosphate guanylyltransferase
MNRERREFILGGQKSGKSRRAEMLASAWLSASPNHRALLIATAQPWDDEMRERIARHQMDRAERVPGMVTIEEPRALADALHRGSEPHTLVVVDCLTLWLTNLMMPLEPADALDAAGMSAATESLCAAIASARGPVVLVGNEIGLGVIPMGREVRAFVDALGQLNQAVAAVCDRVTLMVAGLPLVLKGAA